MEFQQRSIAAGFQHSAAISEEGKLYLWGDNNDQQLKSFDISESYDNGDKKFTGPKVSINFFQSLIIFLKNIDNSESNLYTIVICILVRDKLQHNFIKRQPSCIFKQRI